MTPVSLKSTSHLRLVDWNRLRAEFTWIHEGPPNAEFQECVRYPLGQAAILIRKGGLAVETRKGSLCAHPGQWIVTPYGTHIQQCSAETELLSVHFQLKWSGGPPFFYFEPAARLQASAVPELEKKSDRLLKFVVERFPSPRGDLLNCYLSVSDHFSLSRYFSDWIHAYINVMIEQGFMPAPIAASDSRISKVMQALIKLSFKAPYNNKTLAKELGMSVGTLDRLFVNHFGITPRQYFDHRKLEEAICRVCATDSIKEIAFELGFSSLQYFSGWFKRKTGVSPAHYRRDKSHHLRRTLSLEMPEQYEERFPSPRQFTMG